MRTLFVPESEATWALHFNKQAGSGFVGSPYQRGGGLGSLFRTLFRAIIPMAKSAGRTVGKQALKTGAQVATDILAGENVKQAVKRRGRQATADLFRIGADKIEPKGRKRQTKAKTIKGPASKRKRLINKKEDQFGVYYS